MLLAVILAGGKGSRLDPLTRDRAKPAVPFGGSYRIIDFALSNTINSGIRNILVLLESLSQDGGDDVCHTVVSALTGGGLHLGWVSDDAVSRL